jgi:predicted LPLAT superfamily acyltransferase
MAAGIPHQGPAEGKIPATCCPGLPFQHSTRTAHTGENRFQVQRRTKAAQYRNGDFDCPAGAGVSQGWNRQAERGSPFMLHLIRWIALHLGRPPARVILYPITLYFLLFAPVARRASRDFLQRALEKPVRWWHVARHIHHFSATVLDRVFLLTGKYTCLDIRIHKLELLQQHLDTGAGCILLGSHIGSFEVLRSLGVCQHRILLKILMQEAHNEMVTRILHALNPEINDTVIQLGHADALLKVHEYLQQGYIIGMLGDRVVDKRKTIHCKVLDSEAILPSGPLLAAAVLKVPVVLFFGIYQGGNRYDIFFEEFSDRINVDHKQRERDLHHWVQKYADRLTYQARKHPYNWFNFYDFWEIHN